MFNLNVRKSVLALMLLTLAIPMGKAFAQSTTSHVVNGTNHASPVVGGSDPEPFVVGGSDPEPYIDETEMVLILMNLE